MYIYIYIEREREGKRKRDEVREREKENERDVHICMYRKTNHKLLLLEPVNLFILLDLL